MARKGRSSSSRCCRKTTRALFRPLPLAFISALTLACAGLLRQHVRLGWDILRLGALFRSTTTSTTSTVTTTASTTTTTPFKGLPWTETMAALAMPAGARNFRFGRCALVGSARSLVNSSLGKEIDSYDTVIRVNRLPSEKFFEDFGRKTDVYVAGTTFSNGGAYSRSAAHYQLLGNNVRECDGRCPFWLVLYSYNNRIKDKQWEKMGKSWNDTGMPVLVQRNESGLAARCTVPVPKNSVGPTAGYDAFWSFLPVCNELRLYGFTGPKVTADRHYIGHNLDAEHEAYRKLGIREGVFEERPDCTVETFPGRKTGERLWRWLRQDLTSFAYEHMVVVK